MKERGIDMSSKWELVFSNSGEKLSKSASVKKSTKARKMTRNIEKMKLEELITEGLAQHRDNTYTKSSYDAAKTEGKLWSKEQKLASKEAKKAERKAKRLAKKTA